MRQNTTAHGTATARLSSDPSAKAEPTRVTRVSLFAAVRTRPESATHAENRNSASKPQRSTIQIAQRGPRASATLPAAPQKPMASPRRDEKDNGAGQEDGLAPPPVGGPAGHGLYDHGRGREGADDQADLALGDAAGTRLRRDPRADVDGDTADLLTDDFALAGVKPRAHLEAEGADGGSDRLGTEDGSRGAVKSGKKAVARCIHFATAETRELPPC